MEIKKYKSCGKDMTLYLSDKDDSPLILLNNFSGDGKSVVDALDNLGAKVYNLLSIGNLNWDHDMTPWYCPPLSPDDTPSTGGADEYLRVLLTEILPEAKELIKGQPSHTSIAGYSLAGLFAIYAMYKCEAFDRLASMSGSLWFPDFREYCLKNEIKRVPDKLYLSLGDREARTRHELLKTVQDNTEALVDHFKKLAINVMWEMNPGNHFKNPALRSAKGIMAII